MSEMSYFEELMLKAKNDLDKYFDFDQELNGKNELYADIQRNELKMCTNIIEIFFFMQPFGWCIEDD